MFLTTLVYLGKRSYDICCPQQRKQDLQVRKLEAKRALQHALYKKMDDEGTDFYGPLDEEIDQNGLLSYSQRDGHYIYKPEAVDRLHQIIKERNAETQNSID